MFSKQLKKLGYCGIDDAVEFLMCGIAVLPTLLMLAGFMLEGAATLGFLLMLTIVVGSHAAPFPPAEDEKSKRTDHGPDH